MRPAFTTLTVMNNGKKLKIEGPIDLNGREYEAYIWVRVTQRGGVEGIGTADKDRAELKQEFVDASTRLLDKVNDASQGGLKLKRLQGAVEDATAMWDATVTATEGVFRAGDLASVEAWALVRSRNPRREFHVYWRENGVKVEP
jgi:hypothetical protein